MRFGALTSDSELAQRLRLMAGEYLVKAEEEGHQQTSIVFSRARQAASASIAPEIYQTMHAAGCWWNILKYARLRMTRPVTKKHLASGSSAKAIKAPLVPPLRKYFD